MKNLIVQRWVFNLHLSVSLAFGIFISVVAATGAIIGFEPEIDGVIHREMSYVSPVGRPLSLSQLQEEIARAYPGEPVVAILLSLEQNRSWQVVLPSGIAYFNQYTGQSLGLRTRGETLLGKVRSLHVGLVGGAIGRALVKWSTVAALPLLVSGVFLWWPRKRFALEGSLATRRFWSGLHNGLGATTGLLVFLLAASGSAMAFSDQARPYLYRLLGGAPPAMSSRFQVRLSESYEITPDRALEIAALAVQQASPYRIQMPAFGGTYVIDLADKRDKIVGERHSITLDPHVGTILHYYNPADLPAVDRALAAISKFHGGMLFGGVSKVAWCLASLLTLMLFTSGIIMAWFRVVRNRQRLLQ